MITKIVSVLEANPERTSYIEDSPMNPFAAEFVRSHKDVLRNILQKNDSFELCHRFCWCFSWIDFPVSEELIQARMSLGALFGLVEVGIPLQEMPQMKDAILSVFNEYMKSAEVDPKALQSYSDFKVVAQSERTKFAADPRFKEVFESLNWNYL
jgi:hypothetical protein